MLRAASLAVIASLAAAGLACASDTRPGAAAVTTATAGVPAPAPMRVMSLNQCTDQLVLMLLPLRNISSVTYLAEGGAVTPAIRDKARLAPINHGLAEEVLAEKPDLIISGRYTTPATRMLAKQVGIPLIEVDPADSFADIRRITRQVAAAVGKQDRAEDLIARMDATLDELKRTAPKRRLAAVGWNGSGRVPGKHSLFNEILNAAGGTNVAARPGVFQASFDLEQLLALKPQPDLLLYGESALSKPSLQAGLVQHRVLRKAYGARRIAYPEGPYTCGVPQSADAARELRAEMMAAMGDAGPKP